MLDFVKNIYFRQKGNSMHINKKILSIALSTSFHGAVISMEQAQLESKQYVETIAHYMSEKNSATRKQNILPFAEWITAKRDSYYNIHDWCNFCTNNQEILKFIVNFFPIFKFPEVVGINAHKIIDVIMDRARELKPESSPEVLTNTIDRDLLFLYQAFAKNQNS